MTDAKIQSQQPILCEKPTLLLLGSMPSIASLDKRQYYGHPRNHFWNLMSNILNEELPLDYSQRTAMLQRHGVLLWDSIKSCSRQGSLDSNIKNAIPNDVTALIDRYPTLRAVAFNGTMAQAVYDRYFERKPALTYLLLPSSSPVPRRDIKTLEDKLPRWLALRAYIDV
ncbi:DNA-deoxyinosine glycosylase [Christensenellaceae bacterium OttesenSCG-928-M15]|nr:DNA-deoxyinosine glycosylase [Christensenellaceae bacterium OttesenSCG-928-M15]